MDIYCPSCGSDDIDTGGRCTNCGNYYVSLRPSGTTALDTPGEFIAKPGSGKIYIAKPTEAK